MKFITKITILITSWLLCSTLLLAQKPIDSLKTYYSGEVHNVKKYPQKFRNNIISPKF